MPRNGSGTFTANTELVKTILFAAAGLLMGIVGGYVLGVIFSNDSYERALWWIFGGAIAGPIAGVAWALRRKKRAR